MKTRLMLFAMMVFALGSVLRVGAQAPPQFFNIHHFNGSAGDGALPVGNLVEDQYGNIFGMTQNGGMNNSNNGTFFALISAGGNNYIFTNLYNFTGGTNDGGHPVGDLTMQNNGQAGNLALAKVSPKDGQSGTSSSTVTGQATTGGADNNGTTVTFTLIFKTDNGSEIPVTLTSKVYFIDRPQPLTGGTSGVPQVEEKLAKPKVVASGNTLFGVNIASGGGGGVYSINTNGMGYTVLHVFTNSPDGFFPNYSLTLSGSTLYGTTRYGGTNGCGTVWKVNTDGSGYAILHYFTNNPDGAQPMGGVLLSGNTLYGTTLLGGNYGGTVFSVNTNGNGYRVIGTFGDSSDFFEPEGDLILSGNTLYGTASIGGANGGGSVYSINTNGGNFTELYGFSYPTYDGANGASTNSDGCFPASGLLLSGNTLFGSTPSGGIHGDGAVFGVVISPLTFTASPTNGTVSLTVQFNAPTNDFSGNPLVSWNWYFGDGSTSTEQNPSHSYTTPGTYTPSLVGTNNNGVATLGIGPAIIVTPPSVQFTANPTNGTTPLTVQFNSPAIDSRSNAVTNWNWNFGDGSTSTLQNPSHIYTTAGDFVPSLTATNSLGGTVLGYGPSIVAEFNSGLVLNGGFETGDFTGWTVSGDSDAFVDDGSFSGITPNSGKYEAALQTAGSPGYLSETLSTTAGASYLVSFWLNNTYDDPGEFLASWNGKTLLDETNPAAAGWTNIQFVVAATGASTVLQFGFQDDHDYLAFDDVRVTPNALVIQPPLLTGHILNFSWPAISNGFYQVQYTTNLSQPIWQNLGSPITAASNALSAAYSATNRQDFYRVMYQP